VSLQKGEYFCFHSSLCICLCRCIYDYVTVCITIHVNIYRDALIAIYPNIQTLMCYFHVVNCCKKNLRSHPAATQKLICDTVLYLNRSLKVGIGRFLQGGGLKYLNSPGTSTHNGFWVISMIGKFIAVHRV